MPMTKIWVRAGPGWKCLAGTPGHGSTANGRPNKPLSIASTADVSAETSFCRVAPGA